VAVSRKYLTTKILTFDMEVEPEVIASEIQKISENYESRVLEEDSIIVKDSSYVEGMYYKDYYDEFLRSIKHFIIMHTKNWRIEKTNFNRIEAEHWAVLVRD
jgi:hypothetical protein